MVYNRCCKGDKVYIPPFKDPPTYLRELLRFDGSSCGEQEPDHPCVCFTSVAALWIH
uniref:Uncharacterized protein n=1 Tax=Triticum urartu TaxID=4572 RepID=A0A8R7UST7_TRIUA